MAYDNRHSVHMRLNDDMWDALEAIREEMHFETHVQTVRFLIKNYNNKQE